MREISYQALVILAKVLPVEVKSGKSGSLKSLQQFVLKKHVTAAIRFDLNLPTIQEISHITATSCSPFHCIWWKNFHVLLIVYFFNRRLKLEL